MPYDETLAARIRHLLAGESGLSERKMFGVICFMLDGNMFAGVMKDELMVRVARDAFDDALSQPGARPMDVIGRPMPGMVYVEAGVIGSPQQLTDWLERGLANARSLPPKDSISKPLARRRRSTRKPTG